MAKRGKNQKSDNRNPKKVKRNENAGLEDMDDEVDLFHKQRDIIPLDINDDSAESDDDDEQAVLDYKGADDDDSEDEDEDEDEDDDDDDDQYGKSFAKISRTQKYLKAEHGDLEDEFINDAEDTEQKRTVWSRRKNDYFQADNIDFELQSSDDDSAKEEEEEVIRLRMETAKSMTMEDFGIDAEPTLEEIMVKEKDASLSSKRKETEDTLGVTYETVKKDLSSLSKDEQMDVVSSSAPELVGLLSELNDTLKQLDQINPLVSKLKVQKDTTKKEALHYLEVKKLLLLAYSQAITFYFLLKSEGQPVRDHPVIARLVEIKSLLDKTKLLDEHLPSHLEVLLLDENEVDVAMESAEKNITSNEQPGAVEQKAPKSKKVETLKLAVQNAKGPEKKHKRDKDSISLQSEKMLSVRAAFEEKLKQKGVFTTIEPNAQKTQKQKLRPHNSQLETFDDFGDDPLDVDGKNTRDLSNGHASSLLKKVSQLVTVNGNKNKVGECFEKFIGRGDIPSSLLKKVSQLVTVNGNKNKVSGDDDLPLRDDLGERRRKHELRALASAGVNPSDDGDAEDELGDSDGESANESEDELNNLQVAQLAAKDSKTLAIPSEPDTTVDGKRLITQQMEKNRGLTPHRKKLTKNPRKKYKLKHQKAKTRQRGQVRQVRKPEGPYGGETTGINAGVSRSIRFKG